MTDSDTAALDELLADEFTLTHLTGYAQPKTEWLSQIRAGQFVYHDVDERTVSVDVADDTARLVGQIVTDATVYGTHARWQLRLAMDSSSPVTAPRSACGPGTPSGRPPARSTGTAAPRTA